MAVEGGLSIQMGSQCHFEGCELPGDFYCTTPGYNTECGCKKRMCHLHKSKKNFVSAGDYDSPDVCLNCEDEAYKITKCFYCFLWSFCTIWWVTAFTFLIVFLSGGF